MPVILWHHSAIAADETATKIFLHTYKQLMRSLGKLFILFLNILKNRQDSYFTLDIRKKI